MNAQEGTVNQTGADAAPEIETLPESPDELRDQIEETRQELGETVEALAAKVDVKEQLKRQGPVKPALAAVGAVLLLVLRRKRKAKKQAKKA